MFEKFTVSSQKHNEEKLEDYYEDFEILVDLNPESGAGIVLAKKIGDSKKRMAMKIVDKAKIANDKQKIERLKTEIQIFTKITTCRNVVNLYDVFETDNDVTLVMDLVEGGQLFDRVSKEGRFSEETSARIFQELAKSLQEIHQLGVVHKELRPENILCTKTDPFEIRLVDFGHSKFIKEGDTSEVKGDIFALGVNLYFMLFGKSPFDNLDLNSKPIEKSTGNYFKSRIELS